MKKMALLVASVMLIFCFAGCEAENGSMPSAAPNESSTAQNLPSDSAESSEPTVPMESEQPDEIPESQAPEDGPNELEEQEDTARTISVTSDDYEIVYELNDSQAAKELYAQLPLTTEVEPFSNNEMTFYPPEKLGTEDTPLSGGEPGSLSYYVPWGDVVMFYAPCAPNGSLYEIGTVVSGEEDISKLSGTITISVCE